MEVAEAVGRLWEVVIREMGAESDFTSAIKPIEKAAGVVVRREDLARTRRHVSRAFAEREPVDRRATSPMRLAAHSHGAGLSIAISASTSMRGRTTAYWSSLTSTSGTSGRVL